MTTKDSALIPHWMAPPPSRLGCIPGVEVKALIGRGGMGAVYSARLIKGDRQVAVKVARFPEERSKTYLSLLIHEAQVMAHLEHGNIVKVHDFGHIGELAWVVMELVEGPTLRDMLRGRQVSQALALSLSKQVCAALQHAHDRGVIHHDLKPENILVDGNGQAKIIDFGLSRVSGFSYTVSRPGRVSGTLRYMAPEQLRNPGTIDHRIDLFALGVIMYEMTTGRLPTGAYRPPSHYLDGGEHFDAIVRKCLMPVPDDRWQSANDLLQALLGVTWGDARRMHAASSTALAVHVSSIFVSSSPPPGASAGHDDGSPHMSHDHGHQPTPPTTMVMR